MDQTTLLLLATPIALVIPLLEALVGRWAGRRLYRFAPTMNDLLQALGHLVVTSVTTVGPVFAYAWLHDHAAILELSSRRPTTWVFGFVLIDFLFYCRHRSLHRVAFLWASHVVHHEAHQYNFAVAQRNGWLLEFWNWPFVGAAAIVGVPLEVVIPCVAANHVYQLFLHTELVPRLPLVEWLFATPSTHRVHHASNTQYIDRNFGGVLTVWDRLFGTWEPEVEAPVYGTIAAMKTWDPIANNFGPYVRLFRKARKAGTVAGALRVVFGPPSWEEGQGELPPAPPEPRIDPPSPRDPSSRLRIGLALALGVVLTTAVTAAAPTMDVVPRLVAGLAALAVLAGVGRMLAAPDRDAATT